MIADQLAAKPPDRCGCTAEQCDRIVQRYLEVLNHPDRCHAVRVDLDPTSEFVGRNRVHPPQV
jgi:hypothetical protein